MTLSQKRSGYAMNSDSIAVFDTSTLVRYLHSYTENSDYAILLNNIKSSGQTFIVPTPVLGEVFVKQDDSGRINTRKLYDSLKFKIIPFDQFAAIAFADWWGPALDRKEHIERNVTRNLLRADYLILAVAKAQNAKIIYTEDEDMKKLAIDMGFIAASGSDLQPLQPDMIN